MECPKCHYRLKNVSGKKTYLCPNCGERLSNGPTVMKGGDAEPFSANRHFDMEGTQNLEETPVIMDPYASSKKPDAFLASAGLGNVSSYLEEASTIVNHDAPDENPEADDASNKEKNIRKALEASTIINLQPKIPYKPDTQEGRMPRRASNEKRPSHTQFPPDDGQATVPPTTEIDNGRDKTSFPRAISVEIAQNRFFAVNNPVSIELRVHVNSSIVQRVRVWYVFEPKKNESFFQLAGEKETNRNCDHENILLTVTHEAQHAGVVLSYFMFEVTFARGTEYYALVMRMLSFGPKETPLTIVSKIKRALDGKDGIKLSQRADTPDAIWLSNQEISGYDFIAKLNETPPQYEMLELESTHWRPMSAPQITEPEKQHDGETLGKEQPYIQDRPAKNTPNNGMTAATSSQTLPELDEKCVLKLKRHFFCVVAKSKCSIGRIDSEETHNDFVLLDWKNALCRRDFPNSTISRQHAEIECVDGRVFLKNLSRHSSTIVNDVFIQAENTIDLQDDNTVQLGQFLLRIKVFRMPNGKVGAVVLYRMDMLPETFILLQHKCSLTDVIAGLPGKKKSLNEKMVLQGENDLSLLLPDNRTWPLKPGALIPSPNGGTIEVLDYKEYTADPFGKTRK